MNAEALIGTVLGTCTLQRLIGQGGMGAVYLAQQSRPRRQVAVKVLLPMTPLNPDQLAAFIERFRRETNAAASMEHPNIVPVHEYGEHEGIAFLVMPYISGGTLRDKMEEEGPLTLEKIVNYLDQLAAALDYAHSRGVIHRDIKPANILKTPQGRLLLTDFGLVKIVAEGQRGQSTQVRLTGAGAPVGTPDYMAPEQAIGGEVDARADLYSLGVILYQMVTGTTPFQGETPMQIAAQHLQTPPPSLQMLRPELPFAAEQVILRALAKRPAERYMCAKDLAEAFRMALVSAGISLGFSTDSGFDATSGRIPTPQSAFNPGLDQPIWRTAALPSINAAGLRSTATLAKVTAVALPAASVEATRGVGGGGGLLSKTGKFPLMGAGAGISPGVPRRGSLAVTTDDLALPAGEVGLSGANTSAKHAALFSPKHTTPLSPGSRVAPVVPVVPVLPPEQMSPALNTTGSLAVPGQVRPRTTVKLSSPVKVVQVPVVGQPGRYVTGILPSASQPQAAAEKKNANMRVRTVTMILGVVLVLFGTIGTILFVRTHPGQAGQAVMSTAVSGTPDIKATVMAQATATALANIVLEDPLDRNSQNWLTTPPDVYAFKDGAYHIADHGDNGRATVLQGHNFTGPLGYTLTIQEIKGDDTSANNSFGMILRFNQQTKGGKTTTTFYSFEVVNTKGGEYQFWKYNDGQGSNNSPWTEVWHQAFGNEFHQGQGSRGVNTFKIFSDGNKFTGTVNGKKVATIQDNALTSGTIGMIVNLNGTEVAFKNLLLTHN